MTTTGAVPAVDRLLESLAGIGRDPFRGGWSRHLFTDAEMSLREWFTAEATAGGLQVEVDRNSNLWAWWRPEGSAGRERAVVTGSHLDSVPGGGAYDGPLGVVSALHAVAYLRREGFRPRRPLGVVAFAEEEGGRFGVACLGSRLLTGATTPDDARRLRDPDGVTLAEAAARVGVDPGRLGPDPERLAQIECFVELHVEQGRGLVDLGQPIALASSVFAHGRWRITFDGEGNHAGATPMGFRRDPLLPAAHTVLAARRAAAAGESLRATVGRLHPRPGGTNVIASSVELWLDARSPSAGATSDMVHEITAAAREAAAAEGCSVDVREESASGAVHFDPSLRDRMHSTLSARTALDDPGAGDVPVLASGAGHDAAILAAAPGERRLPTGMLFVRNPTGVSHSPEEFAEAEDCGRGGSALTRVLRELLR